MEPHRKIALANSRAPGFPEQPGGNGNLTQLTQFAAPSPDRVTRFEHDWRDRVTLSIYVGATSTDGWRYFQTYDNADRAIGSYQRYFPRNPCEDVCKRAIEQDKQNLPGVDKIFTDGNVGAVVCCGGKKYACIKPDNHKLYQQSNNPDVKKAIEECLTEHENVHVRQAKIYCLTNEYEILKKAVQLIEDRNRNECQAYMAELTCAEKARKKLGAAMDPYIENINDAIKYLENGCEG